MKRIITAKKNGLALVPALLVVALITSLLAHLSLAQQVWFRQTGHIQDRLQARGWNNNALYQTALLLEKGQDQVRTKSVLDNLTVAIESAEAGGGSVKAGVTDAQGRFNLNSLVQNGYPSQPDIGVFERLLKILELDPELSQAAVDWIDPDSQTRPGGAEDAAYLGLAPSYRAANQPFESVEELRLVRGFEEEVMKKIRPFVTVLPEATKININTAPPEVLCALFTSMTLAAAQNLTTSREAQPFAAKNELIIRAGQAPPHAAVYDVRSSYYYAESRALLNGRTHKNQALICHRTQKSAAQVLWIHEIL